MSRRLNERLDNNLLVMRVRHTRWLLCCIHWRLNRCLTLGSGLGVLVCRKRLLDGDALVGGFLDGLFPFYFLVVRKVLEVLGVGVRLISLCLGGRGDILIIMKEKLALNIIVMALSTQVVEVG